MADLTQRVPSWAAGAARWQAVLNAAPIPPRHTQRDLPAPVPVRARVHWERDGVEHVTTRALGWSGNLAYVELDDPRAETRWVWLPAGDVARLVPPQRP